MPKKIVRGAADAKENREQDEGQHVEPGEQQRQIPYGEGIHNLLPDGQRFGRFHGFYRGGEGGGHTGKLGDQKNQSAGDGGCQNKNNQGIADHSSDFSRVFGAGDGAGNREKDQGDNETKQQIQENLPDRL